MYNQLKNKEISRYKNCRFFIYTVFFLLIELNSYCQFDDFRFQSFDVNEGLSHNTVRFIEQDKYGFIWIGTFNGLCRFDGYEYKIYKTISGDSTSLSMSRCQDAAIDSLGNLWIITYDYVFHLYDYEKDNFTRYAREDENVPLNIFQFNNKIRDFQYKNHRFIHYVRNSYYFNYTNLLTGQTVLNSVDPVDPFSIQDSQVIDIYVDRYKNLWVGTFSKGFSKADLNRKKFKLYTKNNTENTLSDDNIREILEDDNGILWIGTNSEGLIRFDRKHNQHKTYSHDPLDPNSLINSSIREVFMDSRGIIWIGTKSGLDRFDPKTEMFFNVFSGGHYFNWVFDVTEDHNNNIWVASFGGLIKYDPKSGDSVRYMAKDGTLTALRFVYEDSRNQLWVGSETDGVSRLVRKNDQEEKFREEFIPHLYNAESTKTNSNFGSSRAYSICEDEFGTIWIGTADGLKKYNHITDSFEHFGMENGLSDDMIIGIVPDLSGHIWLSHTRGISKFSIEDYQVRNYGILDGLQETEFNEDAYSRSKISGEIFFGGNNGFNSFFPDSIKDNPFVPDVYLTHLKINEEEVKVDQEINGRVILEKNILLTEKITLSHREKRFALTFAGIHYVNPNKYKYKYILEGFNNRWIEVSAEERTAVYSNLNPGQYVFKVKVSNNDGVWNEEPTELLIEVLTPWWESYWFRSIIVFILIISVYIFYLLRVSSLKKQKKLLEYKVNQRTQELKLAYDNIRNISEFGQRITANLNFDEINEMIYKYISSFISSFSFGIGLINYEKNIIEYRKFYDNGKLVEPHTRPLSQKNSFSVYCIEKQKTIFINDVKKEYKQYLSQLPDFSTTIYQNSIINVPLTVNNRKIGILAINSVKPNAFTNNDFFKIQSLAAFIAIAMDNAESHSLLQDKNTLLLKRQKQIEEQSNDLAETNTLLEERQQQIEEQAEELKSQSEILSEANVDLRKSNATKDKLFSIIAHDIKNPFNSVLGFSELLIMRFDILSEEHKLKMINSIFKSSNNIYRLLENLLQWSRSQTGTLKTNPGNISIYKIVENNIGLLSDIIEKKNIAWHIDIPTEQKCFADEQMIDTVIRNILYNAAKFTENGSILIKSEVKESYLKISFSDSGIGIEEDKLEFLFELDQSKSTVGTQGEQGTGLGLIICKDFIEKNGGVIFVESEVNKGTTFIFTLPIKNN